MEIRSFILKLRKRATEHQERNLSSENLLPICHHLKEAGDDRRAVETVVNNIAWDGMMRKRISEFRLLSK
jgi:hypothetical protein